MGKKMNSKNESLDMFWDYSLPQRETSTGYSASWMFHCINSGISQQRASNLANTYHHFLLPFGWGENA